MTSVFRAGGHKKFESLRINLSDLSSQQGCARAPGHFQPWNPGTRPGTTPGIPSKVVIPSQEKVTSPNRYSVNDNPSRTLKNRLSDSDPSDCGEVDHRLWLEEVSDRPSR